MNEKQQNKTKRLSAFSFLQTTFWLLKSHPVLIGSKRKEKKKEKKANFTKPHNKSNNTAKATTAASTMSRIRTRPIHLEDIQDLRPLGEQGVQAEVFSGFWNGIPVVVKTYRNRAPQELQRLHTELDILQFSSSLS